MRQVTVTLLVGLPFSSFTRAVIFMSEPDRAYGLSVLNTSEGAAEEDLVWMFASQRHICAQNSR